MIVWRADNGLRVTLQTDHMQQVGEIGLAWYERFGPAHRPVETLLAGRLHDDAWREWEERAVLDPATGLPYHFSSVPRSDYLRWYGHGADTAQRVNPYAGLLVSLHATGLRLGRYGVDGEPVPDRATLDPGVRTFIEGEEARQRRLLDEIGIDPDDRRAMCAVWEDYGALQAWDRLSIFLCGGRETGAIRAADGTTVRLLRSGPTEVIADPFPFAGDEQEFPVRMRRLPCRPFGSDGELRAVLAATPRRLSVFRVLSPGHGIRGTAVAAG